MRVQWPNQTPEQADEAATHAPDNFYEAFGLRTFTFSTTWFMRLAKMAKLGDWLAELALQFVVLHAPRRDTRQLVELRSADQDSTYAFAVYLWLSEDKVGAQAMWKRHIDRPRFLVAYLNATHSQRELRDLWHALDDPSVRIQRAVALKDFDTLVAIDTPLSLTEAALICKDTSMSTQLLLKATERGAEYALTILFNFIPQTKSDGDLLARLCTDKYHNFESAHAHMARHNVQLSLRHDAIKQAVIAGPFRGPEILQWMHATDDDLRNALPDELLDQVSNNYGTLNYFKWHDVFCERIAHFVGWT